MAQVCPRCSRANPDEAAYCHFDGIGLGAHPHAQHDLHRFLTPFKFPSGRVCSNFEELVDGILAEWQTAVECNRKGDFVNFFSSIGRLDLAMAARTAKEFPAADQGLDKLLDRLPVSNLGEAKLLTENEGLNLGLLRPRQKFKTSIKLRNKGRRLLYGTATLEGAPWLSLSEGKARSRGRFQMMNESPLSLYVHDMELRASDKPLEGKLILETNGGTKVVEVRAEVPIRPFPNGALAGAKNPRQLAQKSQADSKGASILFESGAVEKWYKENGWDYPVPGPAASGVAAVQQFFEALGLARPPKVEIDKSLLSFDLSKGISGWQNLTLSTQDNKKPVYAHATAGAQWISIGQVEMKGPRAVIPISVNPAFLQSSRQSTWVRVHSNGNQSFLVTVNAQQPGADFANLEGAATPVFEIPQHPVRETSSAELIMPEIEQPQPGAILSYHPIAKKVRGNQWIGKVFIGFLILAFLGLVGTIAVLGLKKMQNGKTKR